MCCLIIAQVLSRDHQLIDLLSFICPQIAAAIENVNGMMMNAIWLWKSIPNRCARHQPAETMTMTKMWIQPSAPNDSIFM